MLEDAEYRRYQLEFAIAAGDVPAVVTTEGGGNSNNQAEQSGPAAGTSSATGGAMELTDSADLANHMAEAVEHEGEAAAVTRSPYEAGHRQSSLRHWLV